MEIEGLNALRQHAPAIRTTWGLARPMLSLAGVFIATALFFAAADKWFAEWMPDGEIVILALGFLILSRFFSQRQRFQERFGEWAYQAAFARFAIPGLGMIGASFAHLAYIAGPELPQVWWKSWIVL